MSKKQVNRQGEAQLIAEWLATLPASWNKKTNVKVGEQTLIYMGARLTPAQIRAFSVESDRCDARVVTPSEVWIVEGKLIAKGGAYGQVIDYMNQYRNAADYIPLAPRPIVGVVVCQASTPITAKLFASMGIRTIVFEPTFALDQSLGKLFPASKVAQGSQ
jgi:hypothetical protein